MIQNSKLPPEASFAKGGKIQNYRKGFTLIEIMVVIGIMGIFASTIFINSGKNSDRDIRQEADRLATFFRSAQNKSLSGEKISKADEPSCYDLFDKWICGRLCGYGIKRMSTTQFQIYYVYTPTPDDSCNGYLNDSGHNLSSGVFDFRNQVTINNTSGFGSSDKLFFLAPGGEVYKNGTRTASDFPVSVNLRKGSAYVNNIVNIDLMGRIY